MRLSIVIVNWNTSSLLSALLESIEKHPPYVEYEVIVVDNASADFQEYALRQRFPNVEFMLNSENLGYAEGNNQGIWKSKGDFVLLLNPDTEVTEGALASLIQFMEINPKAAAAGCKLVRPDGTVDKSVRSFPYPGAIAWEYLGLSKLFPKSEIFGRYRMTAFSYKERSEVDQPMGSCLILSRKAISDIGVFDMQFPIFFNEVDWLYRAKESGYKVYFIPEATVIHHGGAGTGQAGRKKMIRESHDSLIRFYKKHFRQKLPAPVFYFIIGCIKLGRFLRG